MTALVWMAAISAALLFWIYIGYGFILLVVTSGRKSAVRSGTDNGFTPDITVLVPTYNESKSIRNKILNLQSQDYPPERVDILVVDSASTDSTADIVSREFPHLRLIREDAKLGKAHAINTALAAGTKEIILVSDANATMERDVLKKMAAAFRDQRIGAATGAMRQVDSSKNAVSEGGGMYWNMERFFRVRESSLHSVIAMSGEVSAFRRSIFVDAQQQPVPWYRRGATDDFEMTLWVIRHGYRVAYVADAKVWENAPDSASDLFKQKVRIIVQTFVTVFGNLGMIFRTGWYGWFIFPGRKVFPLFSPWALLLLFISTALLSPSSAWWLAGFVLQVAGYLLAALAAGPFQRLQVARLSLFFVTLNATVLRAWFELAVGKDYTSWQPIASSRK